jgi:hypothetical protein
MIDSEIIYMTNIVISHCILVKLKIIFIINILKQFKKQKRCSYEISISILVVKNQNKIYYFLTSHY